MARVCKIPGPEEQKSTIAPSALLSAGSCCSWGSRSFCLTQLKKIRLFNISSKLTVNFWVTPWPKMSFTSSTATLVVIAWYIFKGREKIEGQGTGERRKFSEKRKYSHLCTQGLKGESLVWGQGGKCRPLNYAMRGQKRTDNKEPLSAHIMNVTEMLLWKK